MFYIQRVFELEKISVSDLYKLYKNKELDDSPYYQRFSDLWSDEKKRLLIDTIINGYDIPKFYFHYIITNNNLLNATNKKYAVIDGKQRINALIDFIEDKFELDESVKLLENTELKLNRIKYSNLSKSKDLFDIKRKIDSFQLDVIHITTDEFDRVEEMFLRLNEGVPVNSAEKRNSIGGYLIEGINVLVKNSAFFKTKIKFGNKRMEHQDLAVKLCLIESSPDLNGFTKRNLDNLVKDYKPQKTITESERRRIKAQANFILENVESGLDKFCRIFDDNDELLRYKGTIPLYYLFLKQNPSIDNKRYKDFLLNFDKARIANRKIARTEKPNATLLQFDKLNQQGAYQTKSLKMRLKILDFYFSKGMKSFKLEMPFAEIGIENDDNDN